MKQLKAKLKMYEQEEAVGQSRFSEVQHECQMLQNKINTLEASRAMLESSLKDETSARSQLVSQLFNMRKVLFHYSRLLVVTMRMFTCVVTSPLAYQWTKCQVISVTTVHKT